MAKIELLAPIILEWEKGFVNDPDDKGGATNMGVTLKTWRSMGYDKDGDGDIDVEDIKLLTNDDAIFVLRYFAWDRWRADEIVNQSVANILVDWVYMSGRWGIKIPQRLLGVVEDGIVGNRTLKALNSQNQEEFFDSVWFARGRFIEDIIRRDPSQKKFRKGWINRLNSFEFKI